MARKAPPSRTDTSKAASGGPVEIFHQMEQLQQELQVLAKRAEDELEALLVTHPEPVIRMLREFAGIVSATEAMLSFDPAGQKLSPLDGFVEMELLDSDRLQCSLALSGREMAIDFAQSRIYLPIVVFENPIAVAVIKVPNLSTHSYEKVCLAARDGICSLRRELKIPSRVTGDVHAAS